MLYNIANEILYYISSSSRVVLNQYLPEWVIVPCYCYNVDVRVRNDNFGKIGTRLYSSKQVYQISTNIPSPLYQLGVIVSLKVSENGVKRTFNL
jgi:hypothetical protein